MKGFTIMIAVLLGLALLSPPGSAQTTPRVFGAYLGGNGYWNDGTGQVQWEPELSAKASLSPHISLVSSGAYSSPAKSWRYAGGFRITVTDVDDPNVSVGVGFQYHGADSKGFKPDEWKPDVTLGYRPWPKVAGKTPSALNDIILIARGWVGIDSKVPGGLIGVRYQLPF